MKSAFITLPATVKVACKSPNGDVRYISAHEVYGKWIIDYDEVKQFARDCKCSVKSIIVLY